MRRADRLFQIIQILRRSTRSVTAAALAEELETSTRTIYRDIADLVGQRVPIEGEAGFGYLLDPSYDMPPLMLTSDEIEAAVLGAQWVTECSDPVLANAARDLVAKITAVVPDGLRPFVAEPSVGARPKIGVTSELIDSRALRLAIRGGFKVHIRYLSKAEEPTDRTVWPVILGYAQASCLLIGWCELRQDFRHFRVDRIVDLKVSDVKYQLRRSALRAKWQRWRETQLDAQRRDRSSQ